MILTVVALLVLLPAFIKAGPFNRRHPRVSPRSLHQIAFRERFNLNNVENLAAEPLCASKPAKKIRPPKKNIWLGLTEKESKEVANWLHAQKKLNLCNSKESNKNCNHVYALDLMAPNKTMAVAYIEGNSPEPPRYAHAIVDFPSDPEPYLQNILVGPLPVTEGRTKWFPLSYPFTRKSNGKIRNLGHKEIQSYKWTNSIGKEVADITLDLWNGTAAGYKNDTLYIGGIDPFWQDDGIISWFGFFSRATVKFDIDTLLPLGLYFGANITHADPSKWELLGWLYDGEFYKTAKDFRQAYFSKSNPLPRLRAVPEGRWAETDQRGPVLPLDHLYPPTLEAPGGSRYFINREEKYVKWMDFEFYVTLNGDTGMRLYNVRYKGKRIIYELGLQEALAHYAGNDPVQSGTAYLDSYYSFGFDAENLVPGWDCPSYSTFLDSSLSRGSGDLFNKSKAFCVFEMDAGYPLARHFTGAYVAVTKNIFLTLRSVSTVGNYDYQFSYEFYMDGSIRVDLRASGYIAAAYWAKNHEYGYKIHEALSGSMHDHVLNYKVDFDILGLKNSMETVKNIPVSEVYPWSNGKPRNTMKLQRGIIRSEDESKLFWGANGATQYKIVNYDELNKYGEAPGYRIFPSSGAIHLTIQNSSNLGRAAQWTNHDLFVTKAKDTEPRSANPYNGQDVYDPLVDFDKFFDGENLKQTDIVTWFNLGMHHVPNTGDLPNTVYTTAHSGVTFMPINYLNGDPSVQSLSRIREEFVHNYGAPSHIITFGQDKGSCQLNYTEGEGKLYSAGRI